MGEDEEPESISDERHFEEPGLSIRRTRTFKGGVHPGRNKAETSSKAVLRAPLPPVLSVPLTQHIGAPNEAVVTPGEHVELGQVIGDSGAFIAAPVHAPAAGTVEAVADVPDFRGKSALCVVIAVDSEQPGREASPRERPGGLTAERVRVVAREAGLVGMGGAAFPTHVKLTPPADKAIDTVIVNGCECEPYLTCDHRLMLERAPELVGGLRLFMRAVDARRGIIGIEADKMDAVESVRAAASSCAEVHAAALDVKFPQGSEKQLIHVLTGRDVPPGKLPSEVGCLVQNAGTAVALYEAAATGKPLYERVVTITGPLVARPGNYLARLGSPLGFLLGVAGGLAAEPARVIAGGPMTGWAQGSAQSPLVKGMSGIIALPLLPEYEREERACVRCGKCVDACPMFLLPNFIVDAVQEEEWPKAQMWGALDCFECGCCSYTCPAFIPHVRYVRSAKAALARTRE